MKTILAIAIAIAIAAATPTYAQTAYSPVGMMPGYACKALNLSRQQFADGVEVPVYAAPSASSQQVGVAGAWLIEKSPRHTVGGFSEILFPDGRFVWIASDKVRDLSAPCVPVKLANGRYGFGK